MICVSVQEKDFARCKEILASCQMAEIRGDLCNFTDAQIEELVEEFPNLLYTHRIATSSLDKALRQMTLAVKKGVKYVDVEIEAPVDYLEYVKSYARVNGCRLIISYHNFQGTQSLDELQTIYDICRRKGADIVKIVTTANSTEDAVRVMQLYKYKKRDTELVADNFMERGEDTGSLSNSFGTNEATLVAFCMGEAGKFTRHLCLQLGAPYTYAALNAESATAPGQYTKEEMEELLCKENYPYKTLKLQESIFAHKRTGNTAECTSPAIPEVQVPCSKSIAQRAILAAAFAKGTSTLTNFEPCNDTLGALEVIKALGAKVSHNGSTLTIESCGMESLGGISSIFVGESGLLTRMLIPFAAYLSSVSNGKEIEITGHGSILKRNLGESVAALEAAGATCRSNGGHLPFKVSVPLKGSSQGGVQGEIIGKIKSNIEFSGKESSQIVSGFLMMLPLFPEDSTLTVTNPASLPYIGLTLRVLRKFGIEIVAEAALPEKITYRIPGGQKYATTTLHLDSDWSSAANFAVAGALLGGVTLQNMPLESSQADEAVLKLLEELGYGITAIPNGELYNISVGPRKNSCPHNTTFSLRDCPDLFPIAAVLAGNTPGTAVFEGVERLAQKESNRAESVYSELARLGYNIDINEDKMYICGNDAGSNGTGDTQHNDVVLTCGHNDHRIAMAIYIASLPDSREILLDNIKCIDKSFPSFVERLKK